MNRKQLLQTAFMIYGIFVKHQYNLSSPHSAPRPPSSILCAFLFFPLENSFQFGGKTVFVSIHDEKRLMFQFFFLLRQLVAYNYLITSN